MIQNTFYHINGIGSKTELSLWNSGFINWTEFFKSDDIPLNKVKIEKIIKEIIISYKQFEKGNITYFYNSLDTNQHWRLFPDFRNKTVFLDIETTSLSPDYAKITTISLYDGKNIKYYVDGINLEQFIQDIELYDCIVTYNGKVFDIPFIEEQFKIKIKQPHLDLRFILHSLGVKGGLKGCEKQIGIDRGELVDVDGEFAVYLWQEYEKNDNTKALETLLAYNIEDTINLEILMIYAFNQKIDLLPDLRIDKLTIPEKIKNPYKPDKKVIDKIKKKYYYQFGNYL